MTPELRELYQQVIIDHGKRPRNFRRPESSTHHSEGFNPLCGDKLDLYLTVEDGTIRDVSFEGSGCAISTASASMMTEMIKGKSVEEAKELFDRFHALVTSEPGGSTGGDLAELESLSGVRAFPTRIKCATLAWHAMTAALEGTQEDVKTE